MGIPWDFGIPRGVVEYPMRYPVRIPWYIPFSEVYNSHGVSREYPVVYPIFRGLQIPWGDIGVAFDIPRGGFDLLLYYPRNMPGLNMEPL